MQRTEAIILSKRVLGEADLLLTLFGRESGRLKGIAKNAKKSTKRFGGILESGYVIDLDYRTRASAELVSIDGVSLVLPRTHVFLNMGETSAIWLALECAQRFLPDREGSAEKYELLKRFIAAIYEKRATRAILTFFILKWMQMCGFMPDIDHKESLDSISYKFKKETLDILRKVLSGAVNFSIDDNTFEDVLRFVFSYTAILLGKPLAVEEYMPALMEL